MADAKESTKRISDGIARSNPSKFVLDAIMACVESDLDPLALTGGDLTGATSNTSPAGLEGSEVRFLEWVIKIFQARNSWPVGEWIAAVMQDSLESARLAIGEDGVMM